MAKILIAAHHYPVCSARYITDAFIRLGHDVYHIGDEQQLEHAWGVGVADHHAWLPFADLQYYIPGWTPDLVIIADSSLTGYVHPAYTSVPHVVWGVDNHVRSYRTPHYKHYFLAHAHGQGQGIDAPDTTWLPCAFDPTIFTPSPIPWDERKYDVALVGVMYPHRQMLVNYLRDNGVNVMAVTGAVYDEYRDIYHNTRISLCTSAYGDLAQRFFETAAMGCHVLTDPLRDLVDDETNKLLGLRGFSVYTSPQECLAQIRALLGVEKAAAQSGTQVLQTIMHPKGAHTWDKRALVVLEWLEEYQRGVNRSIPFTLKARMVSVGGAHTLTPREKERLERMADETSAVEDTVDEDEPVSSAKPSLNLGCGKTHFPSEPPPGHHNAPPELYQYRPWINIDKVEGVGADMTFDLFAYPWPLEDNSASGAVLAHLVEHIPHEIKLSQYAPERHAAIAQLQDGWYAFFSELYRVLEPGALVHIISPYGWSDGAITDPTHTRYLTINTFTHSMNGNEDGGTFRYNTECKFEIAGNPKYSVTQLFTHLLSDPEELMRAIQTRLNVVYDFYLALRKV